MNQLYRFIWWETVTEWERLTPEPYDLDMVVAPEDLGDLVPLDRMWDWRN